MKDSIVRITLHKVTIQERIEELGYLIEKDYADIDNISVIVVLKGALIFAADLIRCINKNVTIDCINASSYKDNTYSSGTINIDYIPNVLNKEVLLIDDILDTGLTMSTIKAILLDQGASSVKTCCLLDKNISPERCDYSGFNILNEFVVGYGLDYQGYYRNLPHIGVLEKS